MTFVDREQMRRARGKELRLSKRTSSFSIERNPTAELTRRRDFIQASPDQS
jgi:hypothetical protein